MSSAGNDFSGRILSNVSAMLAKSDLVDVTLVLRRRIGDPGPQTHLGRLLRLLQRLLRPEPEQLRRPPLRRLLRGRQQPPQIHVQRRGESRKDADRQVPRGGRVAADPWPLPRVLSHGPDRLWRRRAPLPCSAGREEVQDAPSVSEGDRWQEGGRTRSRTSLIPSPRRPRRPRREASRRSIPEAKTKTGGKQDINSEAKAR
ncbi:unnamed protein product [Sphagnum tenellum]